MSKEYFEISSYDNALVPAVFEKPDRDASGNVFLLFHGITTSKSEYLGFYDRISAALVNDGSSVLRIDFRGHGDSARPSREFSVSSQVLDGCSALRWLSERYPGQRIIIVGTSFGAPPAIILAKIFPEVVERVFLISPVLDYERLYMNPETEYRRDKYGGIRDLVIWGHEELLVAEGVSIFPPLALEFATIDLPALLKKLRLKVTVVHGTADSMVPFSISSDLCRNIPHVELVALSGMEHGFTQEGDDDGLTVKSNENLNMIAAILKGVGDG